MCWTACSRASAWANELACPPAGWPPSLQLPVAMDMNVVAPAMRSPERWLAVLRIAVGLWFAEALFDKLSVTLLWGLVPVPVASDRWVRVMPILIEKYAAGNPVDLFKDFMQGTVIPHSHLFAQLTALGDAAVGLGLVLG